MSERPMYYTRDGQPTTLMEWATSRKQHHSNRVRVAEVAAADGGTVRVSTVWLGVDHAFGDGPPLLFETMVFGGRLDEEQDRYTTEDEAVRGHIDMVARVIRAECGDGGVTAAPPEVTR